MYPLVTIGACFLIIAGIFAGLAWLWDGEKGAHSE